MTTEIKPTAEAMAAGAMALFGEKYGDAVRVVSVPGFSMELCGGTHCRATGDIGQFTVVAEGGVAAGVRRIEAFTGQGAWEHQHARNMALDAILASLNAQPEAALAGVEKLQHEVKRLTRELSELKVKAAMGGSASADDSFVIGTTKVIARKVSGLDKAALRGLSDSLRDQLGSGVVVIANETDGKVALLVSVSKDLTAKVQAGAVVREIAPIVGGGGGGRPDFAEAGGKDPSKIDAALAESRALLTRLLT